MLGKSRYAEKPGRAYEITSQDPVLRANGGHLMIWAGMYKGKYLPYFNIFWCSVHSVCLSLTMYHSLRVDYDLGLFAASVHYILMLSAVSAALYNCTAFSSCIDEIVWNPIGGNIFCFLLRIQAEDFHDYGDTLDPETYELMEKEKSVVKKRKEWLAKFLQLLFLMAGFVAMVLYPLVFQDSSKGNDDNINRNLPVTINYPFKTNTLIKWLIGLVWMYWAAYIIVTVVAALDVTFSCFVEEGVYHLKKLGLSLRHVRRRAKYCYEKRFRTNEFSENDKLFDLCIKECLNHSVKHHYAIIKYFKQIGSLYFFTLLIVVLSSTFLLCLSGIVFISDDVDVGSKFQFLTYLIALLFHTFVFMWYGEMASETSKMVRVDIYEAEWPESSRAFKTYLIIIMAFLNRALTLSAGGFTVSNLNTFGNILSSAYSYFNLVSVMMGRK